MMSPEKSQVEICLLKFNLEEIENGLIVTRSAWPKLDIENERKFRESLNAVKATRALSKEIEKFSEENVRLAAKRMHLKVQSQELIKHISKAREERSQMNVESADEQQEIELAIRKYEDTLRDLTTLFRDSPACFDKEQMKRDIEKIKSSLVELEDETGKQRAVVEERKKQLDGLTPDVPEELLIMLGKNELDGKIKLLTEKYDALQKKQNDLVKNRYITSLQLRK